MDRTKEFQLIVQATEIPQIISDVKPFYKEVDIKHKEILEIVEKLSKITTYEAFKAAPLIDKGYKLLNEYKKTELDDGVSDDYLLTINNLKTIIKTNSLKATLKLNELNRQFKRNYLREDEEKNKNASFESLSNSSSKIEENQAVLLDEVQKNKQQNEFLSERKRIVKSISEIGQIVDDIAIHVSLQEEQLKRIDEIVAKSEFWSKKALREIKDTWEMTSSNTKTMTKFFAFWAFIFLLFWFVKR